MAKTRKTRKSRFEGVNLDTLNQEAAKITNHKLVSKEDENVGQTVINPVLKSPKSVKKVDEKHLSEGISEKGLILTKRKKGRPKSSKRRPLNTAIEPQNRQRLELLAMLNGGTIADQLNNILNKYFTEIEKIDELIDLFEMRKKRK